VSTQIPTPKDAPAPAPAAPKLVKVEVDGIPVEADSRDNLIEAARRAGVAIPYFCYHPRLSIAGQCRMCLVETADAPGRLQAGCQVRVREGMKILTQTPAVKDNQRGVMEFHLLNHPVDCAICDQSGECKLQDYYMEYDHQPTRLRTFKLDKPKREEFGPLVVYDAERCIMCTRCVRFMDEVAKEPQLAVVNRGDHSRIATFPGQQLDSTYSGNTVDICPVGALLSKDFRFSTRVWFVNKSPSICTGCSNGCNAYVESRSNVLYRLLPRRNEEVNQVWMCDEGRVSYHATNQGRVEWARTGKGEARGDVGPQLAVDEAKKLLGPLAGKPGIGIWVSAQCSVEEAAAAFAVGAQLGASKYLLGGKPAGQHDDFLVRGDKNPNSWGIQVAAKAYGAKLEQGEAKGALDGVSALVAFRTDGLAVHEEALKRIEVLVSIAQNEDAATAASSVVLPAESLYEQAASLINWYGRLQRTWPATQAARGDALPGWAWGGKLLAALGGPTAFKTVQGAFAQLAEKEGPLHGLSFDQIPEEGAVLEALLPTEFPKRAPRPAPKA
jgi:NADH-quinone oxidoreductase subunit G